MVAATRVRAVGWSVAVIDFRPFGGTCALRGCDPKKMLVGGAAVIDHARRMRGKGVASTARIDWPELMAFKRSFTDPVPQKHKELYAAKGIDAFEGRARFTGPSTLEVDGAPLEARHVLIAVGAEPVRLGIPGEDHLATSELFLELAALPRRIVLVGGGYIAAELSHIAARAGAKVTVLQRAERMLTAFDTDLVDLLMEKSRGLGIEVRTRTKVEAVDKAQDGFSIRATSAGQSLRFEADLVVHAAGRKPDLETLNLGTANVAMQDGKLELNEYLQSVSNPAVYAAGDARGRARRSRRCRATTQRWSRRTCWRETMSSLTTPVYRASRSPFRPSPRSASARARRAIEG